MQKITLDFFYNLKKKIFYNFNSFKKIKQNKMSDWDDFGCFGPAKPITCRYCGHEFYPKPSPDMRGVDDYHCPKCGREHQFNYKQCITVMAIPDFKIECNICKKSIKECVCKEDAANLVETVEPTPVNPFATEPDPRVRVGITEPGPVNENENQDTGNQDSDLDEYVQEPDEVEYRLVTSDILNNKEDLEDLLKAYRFLKIAVRRRKRTIRIRNRGPNAFGYVEENLVRFYENDRILQKMMRWMEMLRQLLIYKLEHFNDALYCNLMFHDKYGTRLILHEVGHTKNFRSRITNFLSRVRNRRYDVDRIATWTRQLLGSYSVLSSGLLAEDNHDPITIEL